MIIFGSEEVLKDLVVSIPNIDMAVFNMTGMREGFELLRILPQDGQIFFQGDERVSDQKLMDYIYCNDGVFFEFFSKVIYPFYSGINVYIMVHRGDIFDDITESVIKIIQQRYGYNPLFINEAADMEYLNTNDNMSVVGIYNFDIDRNRYMMLTARTEGIPMPKGEDNFEDIADNLLKV